MFRFFVFLLLVFLLVPGLEAQEMTWVPGDRVEDPSYVDKTDCDANLICYVLAYKPEQTGNLTSYTTNFLMDCDGGNSAVVSNASLVMTDNSEQKMACEEAGIILMHSSGNSGQVTAKVGNTVYLHEICLRTSGKYTAIQFVADEIGGMTTSLDVQDAGAVTERPVFAPFLLKRNLSACGQSAIADAPGAIDEGPLTAWDEADGSRLTLAPNPAVNELRVRFDHVAATADFRMLDATGRQLRQWQGATKVGKSVDVSLLPAGMYYLSVRTAEEEVTRKFIVKR